MLRDQVVAIVTGTAFVVIGLAALAVAAVRRRRGVPVFAWLGVWSALYGLQELAATRMVLESLPPGARAEAENAAGEPFGDARLEEVVRELLVIEVLDEARATSGVDG